MPKAKQKAATAENSKGRPLPGWVWMLTGLIIGLSATFFPKLNEKLSTTAENETVIAGAELETRDFTFYTLLPEVDAVVDVTPMPNKSNSTQKVEATSLLFVLQVGSFRDKQEATRLKSQLHSLDIDANIQDVRIDGSQWFRVTIGPSHDKAQLTQVQKQLANKRINSRLFQVRS